MEPAVPTSGPGKPSSRKILLALAAIALVALIFVLDVRRRDAEEQLKNLTVRLEQLQTGNTQQNQEAARRVVQQVRKLIAIPEDVEPTVATIIDVEALRQQNPFYEKAENGDHLIITPERAILFSATKNIILDVVPVQIQPQAGAQPGGPQGQVTGGGEDIAADGGEEEPAADGGEPAEGEGEEE